MDLGVQKRLESGKCQCLKCIAILVAATMETFYELPFGIEVFGSAKNAGYTRIGDEVQ